MAFDGQATASRDVLPLARYDQFLVSFFQRTFADAESCVEEAVAALRVLAAAPGQMWFELRAVIVTVIGALPPRRAADWFGKISVHQRLEVASAPGLGARDY